MTTFTFNLYSICYHRIRKFTSWPHRTSWRRSPSWRGSPWSRWSRWYCSIHTSHASRAVSLRVFLHEDFDKGSGWYCSVHTSSASRTVSAIFCARIFDTQMLIKLSGVDVQCMQYARKHLNTHTHTHTQTRVDVQCMLMQAKHLNTPTHHTHTHIKMEKYNRRVRAKD
jgi:hypothetical protein